MKNFWHPPHQIRVRPIARAVCLLCLENHLYFHNAAKPITTVTLMSVWVTLANVHARTNLACTIHNSGIHEQIFSQVQKNPASWQPYKHTNIPKGNIWYVHACTDWSSMHSQYLWYPWINFFSNLKSCLVTTNQTQQHLLRRHLTYACMRW